jgi:predicted nucleic acid-binding protein
MRVLIDTNIILDVLLDRAPWVNDSSQIWAACDTRRIVGFITASALTDIFYIARRQSNLATARISVGLCLATFEICLVDRSVLEHATELAGADFEDNVQIAGALRNNLVAIVTRNTADFATAPIPVLSPAQLLAQI